jgi:H+/gluconate symporter-like permease
MDSFPGTPQIQNIIPTTFFKTTTWAAPILGTIGGLFILGVGLLYLEWRRRQAKQAGEGYGTGHTNEPEPISKEALPNPWIAIAPLALVLVFNFIFTTLIPKYYGTTSEVALIPGSKPIVQQVSSVLAIWAVEGALVIGILFVLAFGWKQVASRFATGSQQAIAGSLLASLNTASEYGFGAVIAAIPGFIVIRDALQAIPNPLVNIAISVTVLAGITGSASGGMSIALAAMADQFIAMANAVHIPLELLHRVAAMASGGMDTLPHNGAVITLLNVTGLTHRQSYKDIFAITVIKTSTVFVVILLFYLTGIV